MRGRRRRKPARNRGVGRGATEFADGPRQPRSVLDNAFCRGAPMASASRRLVSGVPIELEPTSLRLLPKRCGSNARGEVHFIVASA